MSCVEERIGEMLKCSEKTLENQKYTSDKIDLITRFEILRSTWPKVSYPKITSNMSLEELQKQYILYSTTISETKVSS